MIRRAANACKFRERGLLGKWLGLLYEDNIKTDVGETVKA
jgi:hypothetical protein